jgi:arylsulfatase A-like enzyme
MDITVRTDRLLSGLFNLLNRRIGLQNVAIVVTADHGVLPVVEESAGTYRTNAVRVTLDFKKSINDALTKSLGAGDWVLGSGLYEQNLYLNRKLATEKGITQSTLETAAAQAAEAIPGVFAAFTRTQIVNGQLPNWDVMSEVSNGFGIDRGGDVMVFEAPGAYFGGGGGTGHGSLWAYDTHVPILIHAAGIKPGRYSETVHTSDIASTLSHLLGIEYPTGNVGHPLPGLK